VKRCLPAAAERGRIGRNRVQGKVNAHLGVARLENRRIRSVGLAIEARSTGSAPEQGKSLLQLLFKSLEESIPGVQKLLPKTA
jgi:hypothetical protein